MALAIRSAPKADAGPLGEPNRFKPGVELAGVIVAVVALALLTTNQTVLIAIGAAVVVGVGFALIASRPSIVVELAIVSMWFDSVSAGPLSTGRVISALAVLLLFGRLAGSGWKPPALLLRAWIVPATFFFWAFLSSLWAQSPGSWIKGLLELSLGLIYAFIIMFFLENEAHLTRAFRTFVWIGIPTSVASYIVFNAVSTIAKDIGAEDRVVGFTGNANQYGMILSMTVPLVVVFWRRATTRPMKVFYGLAVVGFLAGLVSTGSRAGLITMAAMIFYLFATWPGITLRQRGRNLMVSVLVVSLGVFVAGILNPDRYSPAAFFGDAGAGRLELWNAATSSFHKHPVQGWSIGAFRTQMLDILTKAPGGTLEITRPLDNRREGGLEVHNTFLTILLDLGVIGLVIFLLNTVVVAKNLFDLRRTQWRDWAWALGGCNLCTLVAANFGSQYNAKFQWMLVGVSGAAYFRTPITERRDRIRSHRGLAGLRESLPAATISGERSLAAPMDLRLRYPFAWVMLGAMALGLFLGYAGASVFGASTYGVYDRVLVVNFDKSDPRRGVQLETTRIQAILATARSTPFLAEVRQRAGLSESVDQLATMIDATRPSFSSIIRITAITDDEAKTRRIGAVLVDSLDAVVDRTRSGALAAVSQDGRSIAPDLSPDYRGPLYQRLFDDQILIPGAPRTLFCGLIGAGIGGLIVLFGAMAASGRQRLSSAEDISQILGVPFIAAVPRPVVSRSDNAVVQYRGAADLIDDACPESPRMIAFCGDGIATLQSRVVVGAAASLAQVAERRVILVDLDVRRRALSRQLGYWHSKGVTDVVDGEADLDASLRPVRRWFLPRTLRKIVKGNTASIELLPAGSHRGRARVGSFVDEDRLAATLAALPADALIVVNIPTIPGPVPLRSVLRSCDAVLVTVLDGVGDIEDTKSTIDAVEAAATHRLGYLLVTQ